MDSSERGHFGLIPQVNAGGVFSCSPRDDYAKLFNEGKVSNQPLNFFILTTPF
jgi:hypothetical protein